MAQVNDGYLIKRNINRISKPKKLISATLALVIFFTFCACSSSTNEDPNAPDRDNTPKVLNTKASGKKEFSGKNCKIDYSNAKKGYVMAQYTGSNSKVKFQLTADDVTYTYDLSTNGDWVAFPLSLGDGKYTAGIFENISGEQYSQLVMDSFTVKLKDEFAPFLRPNQYVNFTKKTEAIKLSEEICEGSKTDLGAVDKMFEYITKNITYDYDKAATVQPGYLPNIDETLKSGKGICFDYASTMTAMLRAQGIPCKLVIGYAGTAYHAWISVYLEEHGWVDDMIEFHGDEWTLMDPTFASSGDSSDPNVVGDGENYNPSYYY